MSWDLQSIYILTSGMERAKEQVDITTNNLANVSTPGFKKVLEREMTQSITFTQKDFETLLDNLDNYFKDMKVSPQMLKLYKEDIKKYIDIANDSLHFARFRDTKVIYTQGALKHTDRKLDLAIEGRGFFVIKVKDKKVLTRDGHFFIRPDGKLVTSQGYSVLDTNNIPIILPPTLSENDIYIDSKGNIFYKNIKLTTIKIEDYEEIRPLGKNFYEGVGKVLKPNYNILQGYLETSNVNIVKEMVKLIEQQRRYEIGANLIKALDNLNNSSNDLGRV
ncbi:MAG TPA: flagellar hook-basal body protein [Aquificae bacterium]|nr:flagellar hook-basal body protein [Aquificota bacterium]